jgi:hypothetical protein
MHAEMRYDNSVSVQAILRDPFHIRSGKQHFHHRVSASHEPDLRNNLGLAADLLDPFAGEQFDRLKRGCRIHATMVWLIRGTSPCKRKHGEQRQEHGPFHNSPHSFDCKTGDEANQDPCLHRVIDERQPPNGAIFLPAIDRGNCRGFSRCYSKAALADLWTFRIPAEHRFTQVPSPSFRSHERIDSYGRGARHALRRCMRRERSRLPLEILRRIRIVGAYWQSAARQETNKPYENKCSAGLGKGG